MVDSKGHEIIQKIPGRLKWGAISLKRGITSSMDLWDWRQMVEEGDMNGARKNGSVVMLDRAYTEKARWDFQMGWPSKVSGSRGDCLSLPRPALRSPEIPHTLSVRS